MAKTDNLYVRIDPELKEKVSVIFDELGIPMSVAISMYFKQVLMTRGIPFNVTVPAPKITDITDMTDEEIDAEIEKGYADYINGNMIDGEVVFEKYRRIYGK
nr:type II toxin-antitoxin system RelB/DinJ family antitoxin [Clostridia bacterium]